MSRLQAIGFLLAALLPAADESYEALSRAYEALQAGAYREAIQGFRRAAALETKRTDIRENLAYTLLKIGETEDAREVFLEAMTLDPEDQRVALEYAFLCHETRKIREARLVFDRLRREGAGESRATAQQAYQNIDGPLAEGIARWKQALVLEPGNFSAHQELARLAEQRSDWALAAEHYEAAWKLRPGERALLVALGRAWDEFGRKEDAMAAWLAASRGAEPRTAESALELLGPRYPYVYEFRRALELDPSNVELRRELGYLLLEMGDKQAAELEVRVTLESSETFAREMAERSYAAGYLNDALKYFTIAHEDDPGDHAVMLKLGYTHNMLKQDREAVEWFDRARNSPDPQVAKEARRAYSNLKPQFAKQQTTAWVLPFFSSRWRDVFAYGQMKSEFRAGSLPLRPYLSMRFVGDARGQVAQPFPQYLSEKATILGAGVATPSHRGLMAWAEAGRSFSYQRQNSAAPQSRPDYRGGVSYGRGFGHMLGASRAGAFFENHEDAVYVSRFDHSILFYTQSKVGWTAAPGLQVYGNFNVTADAKRQYWANFVEAGPGLRVRLPSMPQGMALNFDVLRGVHTVNRGNPRRPNYFDVRAGFWYAFTR